MRPVALTVSKDNAILKMDIVSMDVVWVTMVRSVTRYARTNVHLVLTAQHPLGTRLVALANMGVLPVLLVPVLTWLSRPRINNHAICFWRWTRRCRSFVLIIVCVFFLERRQL